MITKSSVCIRLFNQGVPSKATEEIKDTVFGMTMLVRLLQFLNVSPSIDSKPSGREMLVNFEQPLNALSFISVMPSGITSSPDMVSLQEVRIPFSTVIRPAFRYSSQDFGSSTSSVGLLSGALLGTAAVVPDGFGAALAEETGALDAFGAAEAVAAGTGDVTLAAGLTVTLMTHFFMPFAETVIFAAPAFLPVMRMFFFTAYRNGFSDGYGYFGLIDLDLGGGLSPTGLNRRQDRGGQESQDCKTGNELFFRFLHCYPPCILVIWGKRHFVPSGCGDVSLHQYGE